MTSEGRRVTRRFHVLFLATAVGLGGCASLPVGPNVLVLPGNRKSLAQFQADDTGCREWAGQRVGVTPAQASNQDLANGAAIGTVAGADRRYGEGWTIQNRYDAAYVQCMYATGNQVPLPRGSSAYSGPVGNSVVASVPPGVPPPPAGIPPAPPRSAAR